MNCLPEPEIEGLAERIGWPRSPASLRIFCKNVMTIGLTVAVSHPHPWREQRNRFHRLEAHAKKAALALRELEAALDDTRWTHTRTQILEAIGLPETDFGVLAAAIEQLTLPARAMEKMNPVPRNEVFSIAVQLAALGFKRATGRKPGVTYSDSKGEYSGRFLTLVEFIGDNVVLRSRGYGIQLDSPQGPTGFGKAVQQVVKLMDDF